MRLALVLFLALLAACAPPSGRPAPAVLPAAAAEAGDEAGGESVTMEIYELMCSPCAAQIVRESGAIDGVTGVRMHLASKTLTLRFDPSRTTRERVTAAVERIVAAIQ